MVKVVVILKDTALSVIKRSDEAKIVLQPVTVCDAFELTVNLYYQFIVNREVDNQDKHVLLTPHARADNPEHVKPHCVGHLRS